MKIAIAMPMCLQQDVLVRMTLNNLAQVKSRHKLAFFGSVVREPRDKSTYDTIRRMFKDAALLTVGDRCVSASWNWAFDRASEWAADYVLIMANDVTVNEHTIDELAEYGEGPVSETDADIWSGVASNLHGDRNKWANTHGCDFSCAMTMPQFINRHGRFDENLIPSYHEDNDIAARVILAGRDLQQVGKSTFIHQGSATIKNDAELDYHVRYWWPKHEEYFFRKWGVRKPLNDPAEIREKYFKHPYNDASKPLSYWKEGMIHTC